MSSSAPFDEEIHAALRAIAGSMMRGTAGHTLEPTAVVHEAWMKLEPSRAAGRFRDREHFMATAARAMRQVLADHAERRRTLKRGGGGRPLTLDAALVGTDDTPRLDVLLVEEALDELERLDPRQARVAELRLYAGLETEAIARVLELAPRTVQLDWQMARTRIQRHLAPETRDGS